MRRQGQVAHADQRQIAAHGKSSIAQGVHGAEGQRVAGGKHGGRRFGQRQQFLHSGNAGVLGRACLDHQGRVGGQAGGGEGLEIALGKRLAGRQVRGQGNQADAPVAQGQQVTRGLARPALEIVPERRAPRRARGAGADAGRPRSDQTRHPRIVNPRVEEHDPVHAIGRDQFQAQFGLERLWPGGGQQEAVARRRGALDQTGHQFGQGRIGQARGTDGQDQAQGAGAAAQAARRVMGMVVQGLHRLQHPPSRGLRHGAGAIQDV